MPDTITAPAPQTERAVFDLAAYDKNLRTIEAAANSGLIEDNDRTALQTLRRITQALNGDLDGFPQGVRDEITQMRQDFQAALAAAPSYQQFVADGNIHKLLGKYIPLLVKASKERLYELDFGEPAATMDAVTFNALHAEEERNAKKYTGEISAYDPQSGNDFMINLIGETALKHEAVVKANHYLSMDEILVKSGLVHPDENTARDLVSDVQSVQAALSIKTIRKALAEPSAMDKYAAAARFNAVRIKAMATRIEDATRSLKSIRELESTSPVLPLLELVSAQMHEAMSQHRDPEQAIKVELEAAKIIRSYEQVAYSLAVEFLQDGPSANDPRTQKLLANLQNDMAAEGIQKLSLDEAKKEAARLARDSAQDLLRATHGNEKLVAKITALAKAAGVDIDAQPLQPKEQLIGEELLDVIREKLKHGAIAPSSESWKQFVQDVLQGKSSQNFRVN